MRVGLCFALAAHSLWGLFPIYWRQIENADAGELTCHRIVWSFVTLGLVMPILLSRGWWGGYRTLFRQLVNRRIWLSSAIAALMIGINWLAFLWAVNHNRVLEASLGYYINPLFNVVLGVVVLGERLLRVQWLAVAIAAVGVGIMATGSDGLPWVSLAMATSFAVYGLVKKLASLPVFVGLMLEVTWLLIPALVYLIMRVGQEQSKFQTGTPIEIAMLVNAGIITIAPLAFFAAAVSRVKLSVMGILQYLGPTLQFWVGAVLYQEPMDSTRISGFVFVWVALLIFMLGPRCRRA